LLSVVVCFWEISDGKVCVLVDAGCVDNGTAADDGDEVDVTVVVVVSVVVVDITECATVVTETFNQSIKVYK
jgi:inorganic pyrophosphatase